MTTKTTRRPGWRGAAALPALALPVIAGVAETDPAFAAIERCRIAETSSLLEPSPPRRKPDALVGGVVLLFPQKKRLDSGHSASTKSALERRNSLPFFRASARRTSAGAAPSHPWWNVEPTNKYREDFVAGQKYAEELMPLMNCNAGPSSLVWILEDMFTAVARRRRKPRGRRGRLSGIEVGFMFGLGRLLVAGMAATILAARGDKFDKITAGDGEVAARMIAGLAAGMRGERFGESH